MYLINFSTLLIYNPYLVVNTAWYSFQIMHFENFVLSLNSLISVCFKMFQNQKKKQDYKNNLNTWKKKHNANSGYYIEVTGGLEIEVFHDQKIISWPENSFRTSK